MTDVNGDVLEVGDQVKFIGSHKIFRILKITSNKVIVVSGNKQYIVDGTRLKWVR
jgi:hypothetical protein